MIFLSVGTQIGFDRLVKAVDESCIPSKHKVFAQIGDGSYIPKNFGYERMMSKDEYMEQLSASQIVVSHAGMGNILSSLTAQKPIIVLPRLASFGEHRNDHQLATVKYFKDIEGCFVANSEQDIESLLEEVTAFSFSKEYGEFADMGMIVNILDAIGCYDNEQ